MTDPRIKAVLIDLDGTLVDTAPDIVAAANGMLDEFDCTPLPFRTVSGFIGKGVPNLVKRSLEAAGIDRPVSAERAEAVLQRHYQQLNGRLGRVYPGVPAGLAELAHRGYRLACVTNKPEALAAELLATTGLAGYLQVLVAGDSIGRMKPDPEPLWHACRLLDVERAHSVLVGDSPVDVAAARAAGMPVFLVNFDYAGPGGPGSLAGDGLIDSLVALPALLAMPRSPVVSR
jgi:phosphoglycolate phosphatase